MNEIGFWIDGPEEHRRGVEQHLAALRKQLESCAPEEREKIKGAIADTGKELDKSDDPEILW